MSLLSCRFVRPRALVIVVASMIMSAGAATAQTVPGPHIAPANDDPPCFCWTDGKKIAEGRTACIRTANGRRLAECGRVINMMSWQVSDEICPES
jgi:hypothetical protein